MGGIVATGLRSLRLSYWQINAFGDVQHDANIASMAGSGVNFPARPRASRPGDRIRKRGRNYQTLPVARLKRFSEYAGFIVIHERSDIDDFCHVTAHEF